MDEKERDEKKQKRRQQAASEGWTIFMCFFFVPKVLKRYCSKIVKLCCQRYQNCQVDFFFTAVEQHA